MAYILGACKSSNIEEELHFGQVLSNLQFDPSL